MRSRRIGNTSAPGLARAESDRPDRPEPARPGHAAGLWKTLQARASTTPLWCDACLNTGVVDCYCGGDLCICDRYGTAPCPACGGLLAWAEEAVPGSA